MAQSCSAEPPGSRPPFYAASLLFAQTHGFACEGDQTCHWCGAPCGRGEKHDDVPPNPLGVRNTWTARHPNNPFICKGCWLWRRRRITVTFLAPEVRGARLRPRYKDLQSPLNHSWWLTEEGGQCIDLPRDKEALYSLLLVPPLKFALSLVSKGTQNHIQFCKVNDLQEVRGDSVLRYTLDNQVFRYTVYELDDALRGEMEGHDPGVQTLIRHLGEYRLSPKEQPKSPTAQGGRPPALDTSSKTLGKTIRR